MGKSEGVNGHGEGAIEDDLATVVPTELIVGEGDGETATICLGDKGGARNVGALALVDAYGDSGGIALKAGIALVEMGVGIGVGGKLHEKVALDGGHDGEVVVARRMDILAERAQTLLEGLLVTTGLTIDGDGQRTIVLRIEILVNAAGSQGDCCDHHEYHRKNSPRLHNSCSFS